jgi:hypothetical protein
VQVRRGGSTKFRRDALAFLLAYEEKELERDVRLCHIDQVLVSGPLLLFVAPQQGHRIVTAPLTDCL